MEIIRKEPFQPDYTNILKVLYNERPGYLPLYEHHIDAPFISKVLGREVSAEGRKGDDLVEHYRTVIGFWRDHTYDAFDYEAAICEIFPGHGAILGGEGPIQSRADFEKYPFDELPGIFWDTYTPHLEAIRKALPEGMKAYGGCGYGIFESAQDLVGYTSLCMMQYDDPELFADLFRRIGDLYETLWSEMVKRYSDIFVFFPHGRRPRFPYQHAARSAGAARACRSAVPPGDLPGTRCGQEIPDAQLRLYLFADGRPDRGRHRRETFE